MSETTRTPSGVVAAAAALLTLVGALSWIDIAARPWQLGAGLLGAASHLERGERRLADGALKKARFEILAAVAAARRAEAALEASNPALDLARVWPAAARALTEMPHLVRAAAGSASAAEGTLEVAQSALRGPRRVIVREDGGGGLVRVDRIEALAERVAEIRRDLRAARLELAAVILERLPRRARAPVTEGLAKAKRSDGALADAEAGLELLPRVLGSQGPRWYLIGMQNNAELRGPGGALLRFALLRIDDGDPTLKRSSTVYDVDVDREPVDIALPKDAWYVRNIEDAQRFGNANWSPDWPSAAQLTVAYARASPGRGSTPLPPIAGVLAVDPLAMKSLMPGVGKYRTRGGRPLGKDNVVPFLLHKAYGVHPLRGVRRAVLIDVVDRFYDALLAPEHPTKLVQGFGRALAHKHMQIWLADRREQRYVERMNWDGGIEDTEGRDYLYVVEQNVGGNKLNYVERQEHTMDIRVQGDDARVSTSIEVFNDVVLPQPGYWLGDSEGLHRPMLNVYVPRNARFRGADVRGELIPTPAPAAWVGSRPPQHAERGKKVWSATLEIAPQTMGRVRLHYTVPGAVEQRRGRRVYRLVVQHQPKVRPENLTVRLALPEGADAVRARGWDRKANRLIWRRALKEDVVLEVSWRG